MGNKFQLFLITVVFHSNYAIFYAYLLKFGILLKNLSQYYLHE